MRLLKPARGGHDWPDKSEQRNRFSDFLIILEYLMSLRWGHVLLILFILLYLFTLYLL